MQFLTVKDTVDIISAITPDEKIEIESVITVLKKKYQRKRTERQQELLENQVQHMKDIPMKNLKNFVRNKKIETE